MGARSQFSANRFMRDCYVMTSLTWLRSPSLFIVRCFAMFFSLGFDFDVFAVGRDIILRIGL